MARMVGGRGYLTPLAPDDLRHPLVAHAHDLGDGLHRQAVLVGGADGFVSLFTELASSLLQLVLTAGVLLGKGRETRFGVRCLTLGTGNSKGSSVLFLLFG